MRISLRGRRGAIILFDFKAAFPSLSTEFLQAMLELIGVPQAARNLVTALYHSQQCSVSLAGDTYEGFSIGAGIRQGCPLSPYLFLIIMTVMFRELHKGDHLRTTTQAR